MPNNNNEREKPMRNMIDKNNYSKNSHGRKKENRNDDAVLFSLSLYIYYIYISRSCHRDALCARKAFVVIPFACCALVVVVVGDDDDDDDDDDGWIGPVVGMLRIIFNE